MNDISIKILPDGKIQVERLSDDVNERVYEAFVDHVKYPEDLNNFLFQWKNREIFIGDGDLCG